MGDLALDAIPKRFILAGMMFLMTITSYMTRVNLSIAIVAMAKNTKNASQIMPDYGHRFEWSQNDQGELLGAYFVGYCIMSIPGGYLAETFGGKDVSACAMFLTSFLTALTPASAYLSKWALYGNRLLLGLIGSTVYPSMYNLISKWAPPDERGLFMACLFGGAIGSVLAWAGCGVIIELYGWEWSFYAVAISVFLFILFWIVFTADTPARHKSITEEEREYIENSLIGFTGGKKKYPPYLMILKSMPCWSLTLLHFGYIWGLTFLLNEVPKYLSEALHFDLQATGFLSSLPLLATFICAFIFGPLGDHMRRNEIYTVRYTRKYFTIYSHVIPGTLLILLGIFGEEPYACVAIITLSLAFSSAAVLTNLVNPQDLAPKFAGSIYGIMNCVAFMGGFVSPLLVAAFTEEESTIETWCYVFILAGCIYIIPAQIFCMFGSGNVQKWNFAEDPVDDDRRSNNATN